MLDEVSGRGSSCGGKPWESPAFQRWMKDVAAMPALKQVEAVSKKLMELNPGFDGKISNPDGMNRALRSFRTATLSNYEIFIDKVADLSPIRALPELRRLDCALRQKQRRDSTCRR